MSESTRDANLGAGIESGLTCKEKIGGEKGVLPGRSMPDKIDGAWPPSKSQKAPRGHTFKNG
jgi:hypothetical protein